MCDALFITQIITQAREIKENIFIYFLVNIKVTMFLIQNNRGKRIYFIDNINDKSKNRDYHIVPIFISY